MRSLYRSLFLDDMPLLDVRAPAEFIKGAFPLATNLPLLKGGSLIGVDIRQFGIFEPEKSAANRDAVFALADKGTLKPVVAKAYPIESFREAMEDAASGNRAGRIVLTMD